MPRLSTLLLIVAALLAFAAGARDGHAQAQIQRRQDNPDVYVANRSSSAIVQLFASPVTSDRWGQDKLEGNIIHPGNRGELRPGRGQGCLWDLRVVYQNGRVEEKRRVELCGISEVVFDGQNAVLPNANSDPAPQPQPQPQPQPNPRPPVPNPQPPQPQRAVDTMIINQGPATVIGLYVRRANAPDWGADRLGISTLRAGGRFPLRLPADQGCLFSLSIHFAGGTVDTRDDIDLCALPQLLLSDRGRPGQAMAFGTGFYVSTAGHVLTTFHTVRACASVAVVRQGGQRVPLTKVAEDAENDLALFRIPDLTSPVAPFRVASAPVRAGEKLTIAGYPARRVLGQIMVMESTVTAPAGQAARFQFQARAGDEPWGAPIYDQNGLVVGIANDPQFMGRSGTAVSREAIQRFLKASNVETVEVAAEETRRLPSMQDYAFPVVLPLDCLN